MRYRSPLSYHTAVTLTFAQLLEFLRHLMYAPSNMLCSLCELRLLFRLAHGGGGGGGETILGAFIEFAHE
jgi:hypothetical protein